MKTLSNKQIVSKALAIGYDGKAIKENFTFDINQGDYVCIVGENGIGKSTFIKTILGLIPPISGSIEMENGLTAKDIGYLPQQTQIQKDFPATVYEVVISGTLNKLKWRPFYGSKEKEQVKKVLEQLGILHIIKKSYSTLSGGQQQRVLLARALCATNKILLLDEPVAGLDSVATIEMYKIIRQLNKEGTTIIMITHNIEQVIDDAQYILSIGKKDTKYITKETYIIENAGVIHE